MAPRRRSLDDSRTFFDAFGDAFSEGREEWSRSFRKNRASAGVSENAPRWTEMSGAYPTGIRAVETAHEMAGKLDNALGGEYLKPALNRIPLMKEPAQRNVDNRELLGIGREKEGKGRRLGQNLGTLAGDLVADNTRNFYWLLNAAQATGNVIAESRFGKVAPDLFGVTAQKYGKNSQTPGRTIDFTTKEGKDEAWKQGLIAEKITDENQSPIFTKGVSLQTRYDDASGKKVADVVKRNYEPGHLLALGIPTGVAINTGLGLMTPFGGAEGYKAALPSDEDPSKTENVIGEVGMKYLLGRTGNLLPYSEFKEVRPDVSPEEYAAYQAFKYDKPVFDINPFDDGQVGIGGGLIKGTTEGIHGPEIQFLGRSLPAFTGILPYATALIGGTEGLKRTPKNRIKGGLIGGFGGLAVGQIAGSIFENERRRRNAAENQLENPQGLIN